MHIAPISEEREQVPIKNWYNPRFEGYSRYFTDIAHAYFDCVITVASPCACFHQQWPNTINDNEMLSYSLTTMVCFLTKEWYGFPAYTVNLFIKAYHKITYKEDLKIT